MMPIPHSVFINSKTVSTIISISFLVWLWLRCPTVIEIYGSISCYCGQFVPTIIIASVTKPMCHRRSTRVPKFKSQLLSTYWAIVSIHCIFLSCHSFTILFHTVLYGIFRKAEVLLVSIPISLSDTCV